MINDEVTFITLVDSPQRAVNVRLLIKSLRRFGGELMDASFRVFELDGCGTTCSDLAGGSVSVIPLAAAEELRGYPFGAVVEACAQAEEMEVGKGGTVAWIDASCIVIQPPGLLRLGTEADAAVRPVHLRNVGLKVGDTADGYWRGVFRAVGVSEVEGCVESFVDGEVLRPYFNSHCFCFNPMIGLMRQWKDRFAALVQDATFQQESCQDGLHRTFLFQAVLSTLLANRIMRNRLRLLPPKYNYPLHLHRRVPRERQARLLNELVIATNEGERIDATTIPIEIREPLAAWLAHQYVMKNNGGAIE